MDIVELKARGISVSIDLSVGHIADLTVEQDGRLLRPLHKAPWIGDPEQNFPEETAPNVRRLSGDFLCAPFGRSDVEDAPPHGWPANSAWDVIEHTPLPGGTTALFRLRRPVMSATVTKRLTIRDGHPFLYQEHVFEGGDGRISVAHHAMTAMAEGGRLFFSAKRFAATPDTPLESDPARGRSILRYPARSEDLTRFPLRDGREVDLTRYPPGKAHEDFVVLAEAAREGLGWTGVARTAERDLLLVLKDAATFPVTMLWFSNGGRDYAPWSSRHIGVLGIEDGRSSPYGHASSAGDNFLTREGIPTAFALTSDGKVAVRQVIGTAPWDDAGIGLEAVTAADGELRLSADDGRTLSLPFDDSFLGSR